MSQNALVRLIYETVDDPLVWNQFLTKFTEAVHAETASLVTEDKAGRWARSLATVGVDAAVSRSYEEYFVFRNPWQGRRKVFAGTVETGEQILSNSELMKTEFYNDFLKPHNWLHECTVVTNVEKSTFSYIVTPRSPHSGPFTSEEIELCSYLAQPDLPGYGGGDADRLLGYGEGGGLLPPDGVLLDLHVKRRAIDAENSG